MKLNISYPFTGQEKLIEINDDQKLMPFMDKHIGAEVEGSSLGDEYKGYVFKISGGNDKQGFPMKQGILTSNRVRVLLTKGQKCYRPRRSGERKRKSVRGCITSNELCVLDLVIIKKGDKELAGLTDKQQPRRLGPKRAGKIRKLFSLTKADDVRKFVVRRPVKKDRSKAPKIQRLVTDVRRARRRYLERQKIRKAIKTRTQLAQYKALINAQRRKEKKERLEKARKSKKTTKKTTKAEEEKKEEEKKDVKKVTKTEEKKTAKKEAPKKEAPKKEAPKKEAPKKEAPKKESARKVVTPAQMKKLRRSARKMSKKLRQIKSLELQKRWGKVLNANEEAKIPKVAEFKKKLNEIRSEMNHSQVKKA